MRASICSVVLSLILRKSLYLLGFRDAAFHNLSLFLGIFGIILGCFFPILFPILLDPSLAGNPLFTGFSDVFLLFSASFFPILSQHRSFRPAIQIRRNFANPCKYCISCGSAPLFPGVIASRSSGFRKTGGGSFYRSGSSPRFLCAPVSLLSFPVLCERSSSWTDGVNLYSLHALFVKSFSWIC